MNKYLPFTRLLSCLRSLACMAVLGVVGIAGCSSGSTAESVVTNSHQGLQLPQIATLQVPTTDAVASLSLPVFNNSTESITLNGFQMTVGNKTQSFKFNPTTKDNCSTVAAKASCVALAEFPLSQLTAVKGSYLLTVSGTGASGQKYEINGVVNYQRLIDSQAITVATGIDYAPLADVATNKFLVLPIVVDQHFMNLQVKVNGNLLTSPVQCTTNNLRQFCSAILDLSKLQSSATADVEISGSVYGQSNTVHILSGPVSAAHLAAAVAPAIMAKADAANSIDIPLINNGNLSLTFNSEVVASPLTVAVKSGNCGVGQSLAASGGKCILTVNVSQAQLTNGSGNLVLTYTYNNGVVNNGTLTIPVQYYAANYNPNPSVSLSLSGSLGGIIKSTQGLAVMTITNNSSTPITYFGVNNPTLFEPNLAESTGANSATRCASLNHSLQPNQSCTYTVQFTPTAGGESGTLPLVPIFQYNAADGTQLFHQQESINVPFYSSNNYFMFFGGYPSSGGSAYWFNKVVRCQLNPTTFNIANNSCTAIQVFTPSGHENSPMQAFMQYNTNPPRFVVTSQSSYVGAASNIIESTLASCKFTDVNGNISCTPLLMRDSSNNPVKIAWATAAALYQPDSTRNYVYVTNRSSNQNINVLVGCKMDKESGTLSNCVGYNNPGNGGTPLPSPSNNVSLNTPYGAAVKGNTLYISSGYNGSATGQSQLTSCTLSSTDGSLVNCSIIPVAATRGTPEAAIMMPQTLLINGNTMYITSWEDTTVSPSRASVWACTIGDWNNCYQLTDTKYTPYHGVLGLILYSGYMYIPDQSATPAPYLWKFPLDNNGLPITTSAESQTPYMSNLSTLSGDGTTFALVNGIGIGY